MITSSKISKRKKRSQRLAFGLFRLTSLLVVAILVWILGFIIVKGAGVVSWEFLTSMPENGMTEGGILPAIVGTLCLVAGSIAVAFPLGVMSGIYVSEYARDNWLVKVIRIMTSNLSGVPSIVFGLFGMALFVRTLGFGDSIIAGSLTLALLVLPIVIRTTEEAMRSIDNSLRNGNRLAVIRLLGRVCNALLGVGNKVEHKVIVEILAKINVELANRHFWKLLARIGHIIAHCKEVRHFKVNSFLHDLRHFAELCSDIGVISGFLCLRSRSFYLFSKLGKSVGFFVYNIFMNRSLGIAAYLL